MGIPVYPNLAELQQIMTDFNVLLIILELGLNIISYNVWSVFRLKQYLNFID